MDKKVEEKQKTFGIITKEFKEDLYGVINKYTQTLHTEVLSSIVKILSLELDNLNKQQIDIEIGQYNDEKSE